MTEVTGVTPTEIPPTINEEVFSKHFPTGRLTSLTADQLPLLHTDYLLFYSELLGTYIIHHANGEKTYVARGKLQQKLEITRLVDVTAMEILMGSGSFFRTLSANSKHDGNPTVNHTKTEVRYTRRGLGLRRLLIMNALSQAMYGSPLSSGNLISTPERKVWDKLVTQGKAKRLIDGKNERYVFSF